VGAYIRRVDATVEPLSTADAKSFLRVVDSAEDSDVDRCVKAAREHLEAWTSRLFITQTWDYFTDDFTESLCLYKAPIASISSVKYIDYSGTLVTLDPSRYQQDLTSEPARLAPVYAMPWPVTRRDLNAVQVRFIAGYGADGSAVPTNYLQALRYCTKHFYDNRDMVISGVIATEVPKTLDAVVFPLKVW